MQGGWGVAAWLSCQGGLLVLTLTGLLLYHTLYSPGRAGARHHTRAVCTALASLLLAATAQVLSLTLLVSNPTENKYSVE